MTPPTSLRLVLSPAGRFHVEARVDEAAETWDPKVAARITAAFAAGDGAGVLDLGAVEVDTVVPATAAWLREIGRLFVTRLCAAPELESPRARLEVPCPHEELATLASAAPPIVGGEYLTGDVLPALWDRIGEPLRQELVAFDGPIDKYLHDKNPIWNRMGRVCFHLAENKRDEEAPFAFGNLPDPIMEVVTSRDHGLFPSPREIELDCSCPDWADMCKHVAAALYGVGARLDEKPELLFALRGVDHLDLLEGAAAAATGAAALPTGAKVLDPSDLSSLFGIEIDTAPRGPTRGRPPTPPASAGRRRATRKRTIVAAPVMASSQTPAKRAIRSKPRKAVRTAQRPTQLRGIADLIAAALTRALTGGRRRGRHNP